eukprot:2904885-Pleurochrysis_carterae.AAC.1
MAEMRRSSYMRWLSWCSAAAAASAASLPLARLTFDNLTLDRLAAFSTTFASAFALRKFASP